ncbi:putative candidate secreted effector protein [Blumeria hordei DH14]|uniref:Putative candidate secreted effector protein n=1 Tax=Blumeria graminis f. sp. hordei (strain DH14) TaxID=546991 RepID=N1JGJ6_BLUG1|nr:putative candidate secreted effector protein [Blumeria hordei DH14]
MKLFCLTFMSVLLSFSASVNAAMFFRCPSHTLILIQFAMNRAQEILQKVDAEVFQGPLGQNTLDGVTISGSMEGRDLFYTGEFVPDFRTENKYKISINGITTDIYITETTPISTGDCTIRSTKGRPPPNRMSAWFQVGA